MTDYSDRDLLRELEHSRRMRSEAEKLSHTGAWEWDRVADRWTFSDEWLAIHGCTEPGLGLEEFLAFAHPDDSAAVKEAMENVCRGIAPYDIEYRIVRKSDGKVRYIHARGRYIKNASGEVGKVYGFDKDITERREQELAFQEQNSRLRTLAAVVEKSNDFIGISTPDMKPFYVNEAGRRMVGLDSLEEVFRTDVLDYFWPEDLPRIREEAIPAMQAYGRWSGEVRYRHFKTGAPIDTRWSAFAIRDDDGNVTAWATVSPDLTPIKQKEASLREKEERYRSLFHANHAVILLIDPSDGQIIDANPAACAYYGYALDEITALNIADINTLSPGELRAEMQRAKAMKCRHFEFRHRLADGRIRDVEAFSGPIYVEGRELLYSIVHDVTEHTQAMEALRESERRFRTLFEQAAVGMGRVSFTDARWIDVNETFCRMLGYTREEMTRTPWPQMTHPDDVDLDLIPFRRMAAGELDSYTVEKRFIHKQGHHVWARLTLSLVRDAKGRPDYEIAVIEDITQRKTAEAELESTRQLLSEGQKIAHVGTFEYIADTRKTVWSEEEYRIYGLDPAGPSPDYELMLKKCIHPDDAALLHQAFAAAVESCSVFELEHRLVRPDGSVRWVYNRANPYVDRNGRLIRYIGATLDITERKEAEKKLLEHADRIRASLEEKEVLLKEIHHRVKNNMQVISSLISLQSEELQDAAVHGAMEELARRVRSMAMVHEKLYQSADLARVNFADYAQDLLGYLWRSYGTAASGIHLNLDLKPVFLSVVAAVPCGLILNELVSNAIKHAFAGRTHGEITVFLERGAGNRVRLRVSDSGNGLPAGFDWQQSPSLGLRLVRMLARQLRAEVEVSSDRGADFTIVFREKSR